MSGFGYESKPKYPDRRVKSMFPMRKNLFDGSKVLWSEYEIKKNYYSFAIQNFPDQSGISLSFGVREDEEIIVLLKMLRKMKKFWMAFAAVALIVAALPSCGDSDDPVTPPQNGTEDVDPNPDPETASFTLAVSNVTTSDFALTVTPKNYTGNYYVAAVSGAEGYTGEEIAEILIAQDIEDGIDLGLVDNEYVYNGAASIPSLHSLWQFASGANVTVVVFGVSATGEILTDVAVEHVQLQPLAESDFVLSIGEVTAATAQVMVSGTPGKPFYLGVFLSSDVAAFDPSELADVIISSFGEEVLEDVFSLPEGETSATITYQGLSGDMNYTAVLFGIDPDTISPVSETLTASFKTPAAEIPTGEFGTITVSNITDTTIDLKIEPNFLNTPYLLNVEYASYVSQFETDSELFAADMEFFNNLFADQISSYGSLYNMLVAFGILDSGVVEGPYEELDPGTEFCVYTYYMNSEETLNATIAKAYFKTTGTATSSVKSASLKSKKGVRSMPRNYVERLNERPVMLGSVAVRNLSRAEAPAFGKVR